MDLTVAAIPFYFGSMFVENRALQRRAKETGEITPGDYARDDTVASLSMGVGSLFVPLASYALVKHVIPGKGRYGKALVGTAVGAAITTTVADKVAAKSRRAKLRRAARKVATVGGVVSVATGGLAAASFVSSRTDAKRMWRKGEKHDLGAGALGWTAAIAGWDFIYYWNHRFMHEVRAQWAIHVVHHSSEHYNLSTALRQPVADVLGMWVPYGLLARVGVRPHLIAQARAINLIYQFWIHTDVIRRIGVGEEVLNTPSHHRVHHGANQKYIDRNHGSILILWDRLFGTFQREEEPVVYGLTKNINTYNPARIASHEYVDIVKDVAGSTNWKDRLSYVFRGPGWAYARHAARHEGGVS